MIIELYDIAEGKETMAHTIPPPEGCTLGTIMRHDREVAKIIPYIARAAANGQTLRDWENYEPGGNDRIRFDIKPLEPATVTAIGNALYYAYVAIQVAIAVYSIVSLFMRPKTPKQQGDGRGSGTYSFEGLRTTIAPGFPIRVVYGKHRQAGQLLMYYLTMLPDKSGLAMNMLLSMGEGPISAIEDVEINEIGVSMLDSVTMETRLGYSSQSIIEGFETIKNTYYDGREISDERELVKSLTACSQIIYRTSGFDVLGIEHFVNAPAGITNVGLSSGQHYGAWVDYTVEYRDAQSDICENPAWSDPEVHRINGKDSRVEWNNGLTNFPYASRWDVRFTWVNANRHPARNPDRMNAQVNVRIMLQDVTEIRGPSGTFSHEALLAIRAAPNRDLHGGRPNATAVTRGRLVDNYATTTSLTNQWTQNPAWPVLDYITNSRYGMGAYVQTADVDLQSFIDFATLANSQTDMCPETNPETNTNIGKCFGTPDFHHGDPPRASGGIDSDPNVYECGEYNSRYDGVNQYGFCRARMCCDPSAGAPGIWGVFSGEYFCEWQESWIWLTRVTTGSPIFGIIGYMTPESSAETCTAYGLICDPYSSAVIVTRWNNQSVNTYGTIIATFSMAYDQGDYFLFQPNPDYDTQPTWGPESRGVVLRLRVITSNDITKLWPEEPIDTSPQRVDARTVAIAGLSGVVVLPAPNDRGGDFHSVVAEDFGHSCGLCYDGQPLDVRTFDYTCSVIPPAASKKQYTFIRRIDG